MLSPKKEKTEKVKLTKDSYRKAKGIFSYLKPYAFVYFISIGIFAIEFHRI